jgi:hypothetical protein
VMAMDSPKMVVVVMMMALMTTVREMMRDLG